MSAARSSPPPASALKGLDGRRVGRDGSSLGGGGGSGWRRRRVLLLAPAVIGASSRRPPMRLLAGWLCLSLASVWLARRMWTLRSPLTRSLYVNMTSGPGGPAAAAGGRKENHQVRGRTRTGPGGAGAGRPAFPRSARLLCGALRREAPPRASPRRPGPWQSFPPTVFWAGRPVRAPRLLLFGGSRGGRPSVSLPGPGASAPEPRIVPGSRRVIADARPLRRPLPAAGRRNFRAGAWRPVWGPIWHRGLRTE